jgi:hypothetical protein
MQALLKRLWQWLDTRRALQKCGCACFCPYCNAVLNVRARVHWIDSDDLTAYRCQCGKVSRWDFKLAPVPLLIDPSPR